MRIPAEKACEWYYAGFSSFYASTDYACTRKRIHEQSPLFHKCRLNHGAKLMSNPSISKGRQNFVTELQILASCICPIGPKIRMCLLKWIYCVDMIDIFLVFMREQLAFTKVGTCFAEKKRDGTVSSRKIPKNEGNGKGGERFHEGARRLSEGVL